MVLLYASVNVLYYFTLLPDSMYKSIVIKIYFIIKIRFLLYFHPPVMSQHKVKRYRRPMQEEFRMWMFLSSDMLLV